MDLQTVSIHLPCRFLEILKLDIILKMGREEELEN